MSKKSWFRDELKNSAKELFGKELATLSTVQQSDLLTITYIKKIHNQLFPGSLPDDVDEIRESICDGASDRTVDFIHRENGVVTIIQTKHRSSDKTESEPEFLLFKNVIQNLCPDTRGSTKLNKKLSNLLEDIEWDKDSFTLIYLSLAKRSEKIEQAANDELEEFPNTDLHDISSRAEVRYLHEDQLNIHWREVINAKDALSVRLLLTKPNPDVGQDYFLFEHNEIRSFVFLLSAAQIHELYKAYQSRLFNLNIRNYMGDTRTNKEIRNTAASEPQNFFFYNNGLSAVCTRANVEHDKEHSYLNCENFSIINGAQTFRSISRAYKKNLQLVVLMRVAEWNFHKKANSSILDKITKFNNTQNAIKISDFRSNDHAQLSLVKYFSEISYNGKKFAYSAKRADHSDRQKIQIKLDDFCRAVYAFSFGPADCFGGLEHLYSTSSDGGYTLLFGPDQAELARPDFSRMFGIWLLTSKTQQMLKSHKAELKADDEVRLPALERKFLVFYALGEIFRKLADFAGVEEARLLERFADPNVFDKDAYAEAFQRCFELACDFVVQAYMLAKAKAHEKFVHRNFFRKLETLDGIKEQVSARYHDLKRLSEYQAFRFSGK